MKHLSLIAAVLRKDCQSFWRLAIATALLLVLQSTLMDPVRWSLAATLLQAAAWLACGFLILSVIHEDPVVSSQHDWLVRPLPGPCVLFAKLIFVACGVLIPLVVGEFVNGLNQGYSLAETVLRGINIQSDIVLAVSLAVALAAITANLRQAALVFVAAALVAVLGLNAIARVSNITTDLGVSGVEWIVKDGIEALGFVTCAAIWWLQYKHRKTSISYLVAIVACLAVFGAMLLPWSNFFALQKVLTKRPDIATNLQIELAQGCFPNNTLGVNATEPTNTSETEIPTVFKTESDQEVGPNAIAFATWLAQPALPNDERLIVTHVSATYLDGDISRLNLRPAQPLPDLRRDAESIRRHRHYWLLPRAQYQQLAVNPGTRLRLDYSLSVVSVERSIEIVANGRRAHYEGLGYCGATFDPAAAEVMLNCFIVGEQPALLRAQIVGAPDSSARRSRSPDYVPSALDSLGARRHLIRLPANGIETPRVKITTYEALAHFDRQLVLPGVLGGPVSVCPAPSVR